MCVQITQRDIVAEEDIIAYKVVRSQTVDGKEVYCSEYDPDQRWGGYDRNPGDPLGTMEYYEIGQLKTDMIGSGFYLFANRGDVVYAHTVLEVMIPKGTTIQKGLNSLDEESIISKTILPVRVADF